MWRETRKEELVSIAGECGPVLVYDGETLNDIVFDLLCLDCVDRLLFDLGLSYCPELLEALGRLGAGFQCRSLEEAALVYRISGGVEGLIVFLLRDGAPAGGSKTNLHGLIPAIPLSGMTRSDSEGLRGRDVLVVLDRPVSPRTDAGLSWCLRELDRVHARVRGLYLPWGRGTEFEETKYILSDWQSIAGRDGVLVPARGMGLVLERETGFLDLDSTAGNFEELKSIFPDGAVWVEPGAEFFSVATALVEPADGQVHILARGNLRLGGLNKALLPEERYLRARRICQVPL